MRLDEDDFEDYEGGFDDDAAVEEVMKAVPQASEDDAWASLEKYDFDVDAAIADLKTKQKPQPKPAPTPIVKKLPKQEAKPAEKAEGKSKLQQLALKKQQNGPRGDALSKLRKNNGQESKKSALAQLLSKRAAQSPSESESDATPVPESLRTASSTPVESPKEPATAYTIAEPEIPHVDRPSPTSFGSLLGFAVPNAPQCAVSNSVKTPQLAPQNFAKPSPDDKVSQAQEKGFKPAAAAVVPVKKAPVKAAKEKDLKVIAGLSLKPHISFVVIGHVDAGKSTLMGRLLVDAGEISKRVLDGHQRESEKMNKSSFALAWVMDATSEERARGVTVDVGEAGFETSSTKFTIVDAPGHRDYVPNMIAGVAQADIAVLVVDADTNAFESGFSLDGQTKEHAILARSLGIDSMIVAVNKLDTQDWNEDRFDDIKVQLTEFLTKTVGFAASKVTFVPTSGRNGDYVLKPSTAAAWYKGPTLVEALESIKIPEKPLNGPFRYICSNVFQEDFQPNTTVIGKVVSGVAEKDDSLVNCSEQDVSCTIKDIKDKAFAIPGEITELKLDLSTTQCRPGDVLSSPDSVLEPVTDFTAKIILFDIKRPVLVGSMLSFYLGRVNKSVKVNKIEASFDKKGNVLKKNPRHLTKGQAAQVSLKLQEAVVLAPFSEIRDLGRFVLRLDGSTIGGGVIQSVTH